MKLRGVIALLWLVATGCDAQMGAQAFRAVVGDQDWNTTAALFDTATHALARQLVGTDFHTYQRQRLGLTAGQTLPPFDVTRANSRLCGEQDGAPQWLALECRAISAVNSEPYCGENKRCTAVQIAPFVLRDPMLFTALNNGLRFPNRVLPEPIALGMAHQLKSVHMPGTLQPADRNWFWTFSDTSMPVSATLQKEAFVYVMHHYRGR